MTKNNIFRHPPPPTIPVTVRRIEGACLLSSPSNSLGQHHQRNPVTVMIPPPPRTIPVTARRIEGACLLSSPSNSLGQHHRRRAVTVKKN
ncbi:hypothetical protein XENTR_v10010998 [Xenopus tropicalis]|nr:hypothetical protein XENTR_v10010998 [Xenopus tropicalis]